jgi:hypothetical protein
MKNVFISYAHLDGASLAEGLAKALSGNAQVWMDTSGIDSGDRWTGQIEAGIDSCDVFVAILTRGAVKSPVCRAELERAVRKGKRVLPWLVHPDADLPIIIESVQWAHDASEIVAAVEGTRTNVGTRHRNIWSLPGWIFGILFFGLIIYGLSEFVVQAPIAIESPPIGLEGTGVERVLNVRDAQHYIRVNPKAKGLVRRKCESYGEGRIEIPKPFWISEKPVSGKALAKFTKRNLGGWFRPESWEFSDKAVTGLDFQTAASFCQWAGLRVLSESEWLTVTGRFGDRPRFPNEELVLVRTSEAGVAQEGSVAVFQGYFAIMRSGCPILTSALKTANRSWQVRCAGERFQE